MTRTATTTFLLAILLNACGPDEAPQIEIPPWAHVAPEQIAEAKKHGVPVAFENDLGMRFVLIPAGTFMMGSPEDEEGRRGVEVQHEVAITMPFFMQVTEVTNRQFRQFWPSHNSGEFMDHSLDDDEHPVVMVSWTEATAFAADQTSRSGNRTYRLPTEAEWEYACRAGTTTPYWSGSREADLSRAGWYAGNAGARTHQGAMKPANPWGLYDVHGNVWEWCADKNAPIPLYGVPDPTEYRVLRGGSFHYIPEYLRAAHRTWGAPDGLGEGLGFRLVSPLPESDER